LNAHRGADDEPPIPPCGSNRHASQL
jgi:hypothetical protein